MKAGAIAGIVVAALAAVGVVVWIAWPDGNRSPNANAQESPANSNQPEPEAVADELEHDFGAMQVGEVGEHTFHIRNEGGVPIVLENGGTSCTCTLSVLEKEEVAPGEQAPVKITWEPKEEDHEFEKTANVIVRTSHPDSASETITFTIRGKVTQVVYLHPERSFDIGTVKGAGERVSIEGVVYSPLVDDLEVSLEHDEDMESSVEAATPEELAEHEARAGFRYTVSFAVEKQGDFQRRFTVKTNADGGTTHSMTVDGRATGPLTVVPIQPRGDSESFARLNYNQRANAFDMRRFPAAEGRTVKTALVVVDPDEGRFEIADVSVVPDELDVTIDRDETFRVKGRSRFVMTITFPPGSPKAVRTLKDAVKVIVKTNHPDVPEEKFHVEYVAD